MFIKKSIYKLLNDLDNFELWKDGLFSIVNKEFEFEIFISEGCFLFTKIWNCENVKFNIVEKFLVYQKSKKIKDSYSFKLKKQSFNYFN